MAGDTSNRLADKFKDLAFCFDASTRCGFGSSGRASPCKPATKQVNCCSSPGMSNCCGGCQVKMNQCNCWCQPSNGCCNIQQEYCELKAKYRCLCLKAAQLLQERNQRNLDKDGCNDEDTVFLRGLYPFINTLSTERKLNLRMAFQELMYKYAFNDQVSAAQMMPQNGLKTQRPAFGDVTVSKKKDICLSQSDEEEFYESMLPYLRNLTPEKKLLFRVSFMQVLSDLAFPLKDKKEYKPRRNDEGKDDKKHGSQSARSSILKSPSKSNSVRGSTIRYSLPEDRQSYSKQASKDRDSVSSNTIQQLKKAVGRRETYDESEGYHNAIEPILEEDPRLAGYETDNEYYIIEDQDMMVDETPNVTTYTNVQTTTRTSYRTNEYRV